MLCALTVGCTSSGSSTFTTFTRKNMVPPDGTPLAPATADDLRNPERLHLSYAALQSEVGNHAAARSAFERVLRKDPKSVAAKLGIARIDELAGRYQVAEEGYLSLARANPDNAEVQQAAGQFYAGRKQWEKAIEYHGRAVAAAPMDPRYRFPLGVALVHAERTADAFPHFVASVGQAEAHYNVGYLLYEKGKIAEAERQFLTAATLKPDLEQAVAMIDEIRRENEDRALLANGTLTPAPQPQPAQPLQQVSGQQVSGQRGETRNVRNAGASNPQPSSEGGRNTTSWPSGSFDAAAPSSGHPTMTPAQLEQLRNQRLGGFGD
ncbi:Tetratricopeptide repeat protein [Stratiformator vulcanicus]|uniref:Tetratricopeptide repeat protein n=2 Tax=Stratiformator vulcanicus TaxID=2527980 RepID=A0A517R3I2_9PLAN|nr:Tetratricopeptide repeat protein [Stratiformator vulcanicus]